MTRTKYTIENMQELAERRSGLCLSKTYISRGDKLIWKCSENHIFEKTFSSIMRGNWCSECSGWGKKTIDDCYKLAAIHNGKFLSQEYVGAHTKYLWQCKNNHQWLAAYSNVQCGKWCPTCNKHTPKRKTVDDCRKLASVKGGIFLSAEYIDAHTKYLWECEKGHQWLASYANIYSGRWCPNCIQKTGERTVRAFFEALFGEKFPSINPDWLRNPKTCRKLQLDGYCAKLKLAFEHQGQQHYGPVDYFNISNNEFSEIEYRDFVKNKICELNDIKLIIIPSLFYKVKFNELKQFIINECNKLNIIVPFPEADVSIVKSSFKVEAEIYYKTLIESRGGKILSDYINTFTKITIQCENDHIWDVIPSSIKLGHWCRKCASIKQSAAMKNNIGGRRNNDSNINDGNI